MGAWDNRGDTKGTNGKEEKENRLKQVEIEATQMER